MLLKTLQWNIGGGKIRKKEDDPNNIFSYSNDSLDSIIQVINKFSPDIVTLQESHTDENINQAQTIADALGLKFVANNIYDKSHLEEGQGLSQAIISRYPIADATFSFFQNPKLKMTGPRGEEWVSHEKGVTRCMTILPGDVILNIQTSHSLPFRKFGADPLGKEMEFVRNDMSEKLEPKTECYLYQGDLNYDNPSAKDFLKGLFQKGVGEVVLDIPTTPKGRWYDHVLFRNLQHKKSVVITDVLTDHYPIYSEFEIK